ncbi:MAG: bifunctional folylpolyglutamate synthase/dihydrofolate synthase [Candidatus Omnitrophica bacterium]|nr:bifunctional folylpolyglutamate synthase/dihydrofolate synthase [Candidatus Omnitrophota bacterium]
MTYPEAINYLESFINYEKVTRYAYIKSFKLERIKYFLESIGNPQYYLRVIHVAGSKGKGSTCAFIAYILREAGYKVGLYTSPHLSDFRERIRILNPHQCVIARSEATKQSQNKIASPFLLRFARSRARNDDGRPRYTMISRDFEGMISKKEFVNLVEQLKPAINRFNKHSQYGPLSFFEVYTALALYYFNKMKTDFVILETGLGGRLDATNVVNPLLSVITPISYEHTDKLGCTLTKIAAEKAGIIKSQAVICAPQKKEAIKVIKGRCYKTGAKLIYVKKPDSKLKINLLGKHQLVNAGVAKRTVEALGGIGYKIGVDKIKSGLYDTVWPGRCEVISYHPTVVLDGAHNLASSQILAETIKNKFSYNQLILVLGISNDKDIQGICRVICPLGDKIILTKANSPRAALVRNIEKEIPTKIKEKRENIFYTQNVKEAKKKALSMANKNDLVLVTGSLFVVGEFRNGKI